MFPRIAVTTQPILAKVAEMLVDVSSFLRNDDRLPSTFSNLRKAEFRIAVIVFCALCVASCAPLAAPVATTTPPTSSAPVGYLTGHVSIGPLTPVERVGVPSPTPAPEVYAARSINIFKPDGVTLVVNVKINSDRTYRVALPPGDYVVALARSGIDRARGLPKPITIESGKTMQVKVDIDTGIR